MGLHILLLKGSVLSYIKGMDYCGDSENISRSIVDLWKNRVYNTLGIIKDDIDNFHTLAL